MLHLGFTAWVEACPALGLWPFFCPWWWELRPVQWWQQPRTPLLPATSFPKHHATPGECLRAAKGYYLF